jgi:2-amino-4-hydroxy-6-hydroxymethyldihydropteridine diphosphokinase
MLYYLSLGANLGDREQTIKQALELIEQQVGHVLRCSSFFYSAPWGFESENEFCNLCCAVESSQDPLSVLRLTQTIERALGRNLKSQISNLKSPIYSDRPIDIDLIRAFDDSGNEIKCEITNDQNNESPYSEADRSTEGRLEISNLKSQMSSDTLLSLPHPLWQQRDFVKIPLAEIMQQ